MMYVIHKANGELRSEHIYTLEDVKKIVDALNRSFGAGSYYYEEA